MYLYTTNRMQQVLRCHERQSCGTECKKTLRWPGLRPGPRCGSLQPPPPSWWGRLAAPPKESTPAYGPSSLASSVFLLSASPIGSGRRRLWATADRIFYAGSDLPAQW